MAWADRGRGRSALQSPQPPMAVCGSWDARDGNFHYHRSWLVRVGLVGSDGGGLPSAWEGMASQPERSTELGIPRPALPDPGSATERLRQGKDPCLRVLVVTLTDPFRELSAGSGCRRLYRHRPVGGELPDGCGSETVLERVPILDARR